MTREEYARRRQAGTLVENSPARLEFRELCTGCRRPKAVCLCDQIERFECGINVGIALHPKEFKKTVNTSGIALRAIEGSSMFRANGRDLDRNDKFLNWLKTPGLTPMLMFPGPNARDISSVLPSEFEGGKKPGLLFIDGTWAQARKMLRESDLLRSIPQVMFSPGDAGSRYKIRKQPGAVCVCTVEAIYAALERLADTGVAQMPAHRPQDKMLSALDRLVDRQFAFAGTE